MVRWGGVFFCAVFPVAKYSTVTPNACAICTALLIFGSADASFKIQHAKLWGIVADYIDLYIEKENNELKNNCISFVKLFSETTDGKIPNDKTFDENRKATKTKFFSSQSWVEETSVLKSVDSSYEIEINKTKQGIYLNIYNNLCSPIDFSDKENIPQKISHGEIEKQLGLC